MRPHGGPLVVERYEAAMDGLGAMAHATHWVARSFAEKNSRLNRMDWASVESSKNSTPPWATEMAPVLASQPTFDGMTSKTGWAPTLGRTQD